MGKAADFTPLADGPARLPRRAGYRWELLGLLWIAFFLHQADRQIYNNLFPLIEKDLHLSKTQLGLVTSTFTWIYGLMVPVGGYVGDRGSRKWLIILMLLIWSTGTLLTGLSTGLLGLLVFRGLASGFGEAFYAPSANSLLTQWHDKTRALAMSLHQTALYTGIVASFAVGLLGENFGWRSGFYVFGGLGVLWAAVLAWRMDDTPQPRLAETADRRQVSGKELWEHMFSKPTVWLLTFGFVGMVFCQIGYLTWMPTLLHEKHGLSVTWAGLNALLYHHACAFLGVVVGGRLSDRLAQRWPRSRLAFQYVGLLGAAPFIYLMGRADSLLLCCTALALFGLFRGVYDSNLFAGPFEVVPPQYRASLLGFILCFGFLAGAFAPVVLAQWAERFGLDRAVASLAAVHTLAGVLVVLAALISFSRDYRKTHLLERNPKYA